MLYKEVVNEFKQRNESSSYSSIHISLEKPLSCSTWNLVSDFSFYIISVSKEKLDPYLDHKWLSQSGYTLDTSFQAGPETTLAVTGLSTHLVTTTAAAGRLLAVSRSSVTLLWYFASYADLALVYSNRNNMFRLRGLSCVHTVRKPSRQMLIARSTWRLILAVWQLRILSVSVWPLLFVMTSDPG